MNSTNPTNDSNAQIELQHIQLELRNRRAQHLRHFIDQYYCYKHGYVNRAGAADWKLIVWKGSVSCEARKLSDRKLVVKEHVVPLRVISEMLKELSQSKDVTTKDIAALLDENVRFATISKEEDKKLRTNGLNSKMPDCFYEADHCWCGDLFARYKSVGIKMENDA